MMYLHWIATIVVMLNSSPICDTRRKLTTIVAVIVIAVMLDSSLPIMKEGSLQPPLLLSLLLSWVPLLLCLIDLSRRRACSHYCCHATMLRCYCQYLYLLCVETNWCLWPSHWASSSSFYYILLFSFKSSSNGLDIGLNIRHDVICPLSSSMFIWKLQ